MSDAIVKQQVAPLEFNAEQKQMILQSFLNGASAQEAAVLMELARVRRLNPITKQIHFVKRSQGFGEKKTEVWAAQVGIDGFRAIAERTGLYDGQDEPEFEYDEKKQLKLCRVKVYRRDWSRPSVGVAHFSEYVQTTRDYKTQEVRPNKMWSEKPHIMLAKCAEALAFRKAFPEDTSGLYAPEEMPEPSERDVSPPAQVVETGTRTAKLKQQLAARTATIIDVAPNETEKQAEQGAGASSPTAPATQSPKAEFGPHKGKAITSLSNDEINASLLFAISSKEKMLGLKEPARIKMLENVEALKGELEFRAHVAEREAMQSESDVPQ